MTQKYKTVNGIRKNNPQWGHTASTAAMAVPFANQSTALAVVPAPTAPCMEEEEIVVVATPVYDAAVAQYHEEVEPEIFVGGYQGDDSLDELNGVMAKYEVPAGMLSKLLQLRQFDVAEIIVDDSGSMGLMTDAKDPNGNSMNRWWEAKYRISQMIEIMAYIPCPALTVYFLNRPNVLTLQRNQGELPTQFIQRVEDILIQAFQRGPAGTTPAREAIEASLNRNYGRATLRYFLGDGVPNGGTVACRQIQSMLMNRPNPERNPFTFFSCTNQDDQVEWMKDCEERAPYCAEFDDYLDESREILKDQGQAFPYSFGLHLVAQIVAAFNPHDLDAMDESIPFTRQVLDNLLGYQSSPAEYKYYFDSFVQAQHRLPLRPYQRNFVSRLPSLYPQFSSAAVALDIPEASQYKKQMKQYGAGGSTMYGSRGSAPPQDDCCVIL